MMKLYGLLGYPLSHSFSKEYFTNKFIKSGDLDSTYQNFEKSSLFDIKEYLNTIPGLQGFNITIPYKEEILSFLNQCDPLVQIIHACNCIKVVDKEWLGYNTDVIGFEQSFKANLRPHHAKAIILGTGGASKAVAYVCRKLGLKVIYVSTTKTGVDFLTYDDLNKDILSDHHVIINTTPLGSFPNNTEFPIIPYEHLTSEHYLFDLIYNPEKTQFLIKGELQGAQIKNGYEMLVGQAEESWRIWHTNYP